VVSRHSWSVFRPGPLCLLPILPHWLNIAGVNEIHGVSSSFVVAVANSGRYRIYDGNSWSDEQQVNVDGSFISNDLLGVWVEEEGKFWVSGGSRRLLYFDGDEWVDHTASVPAGSQDIHVWGFAANNVYAVGANGTVIRWNGSEWSTVSHGLTTATLNDIHGSAPDNIWIAANGGRLLHYDGSDWTLYDDTELDVGTTNLFAVWAASEDVIWAAGGDATIVWTVDGGLNWNSTTLPGGHRINDVFALSPTYAWFAKNGDASAGQVWHYDGGSFFKISTTATTGNNNMNGVFGPTPGHIWVVGANASVNHLLR